MSTAIRYVHRTAGVTAFLLILSFLSSTLLVELLGDKELILAVKVYISYGIWLLVLTMALAGVTGSKLAGKINSGRIGSKKKRMPFVAFNGLFILIPAALYLKYLASNGVFDQLFYSIQAVEIVAGSINLTIIFLNMRDGFRIRAPR